MTEFVQRKLNDPSKFKLEFRAKPDANTVCPAPPNEDIAWLDIVQTVEPGTGKIIHQALVNPGRKTQVLAERAEQDRQRQEAENKQRTAKGSRLNAIKTQMANFDTLPAEAQRALIKLLAKHTLIAEGVLPEDEEGATV